MNISPCKIHIPGLVHTLENAAQSTNLQRSAKTSTLQSTQQVCDLVSPKEQRLKCNIQAKRQF